MRSCSCCCSNLLAKWPTVPCCVTPEASMNVYVDRHGNLCVSWKAFTLIMAMPLHVAENSSVSSTYHAVAVLQNAASLQGRKQTACLNACEASAQTGSKAPGPVNEWTNGCTHSKVIYLCRCLWPWHLAEKSSISCTEYAVSVTTLNKLQGTEQSDKIRGCDACIKSASQAYESINRFIRFHKCSPL